MADETYILPEEPVYQEAIRRLQNTDPVDAEGVLNPLIQALIGNTEFVRQLAEAIAEQNAEDHTAIRQETAQSIQQNAADHTAIRQETAQSIQEAVAAIPTPDVSGQIGDHDTDASAHEARFQALDDKFAPAGHSHSAADVGAAPSEHTHTAADVGAAPSEHTHSAADVGASPAGHTHSAADVGASPSGHTHTAADIGASPAGHTHTAAQVGASPSGHKHTKGEITDFPASLPASDVPAWAKKSTKPTYTASEVGAAASGHTHTAADVGARPTTWTPTATDVGAVPTTRKVNGKALNADISLSASDVGAATSGHTHAAADVGAAASNHTHTAAAVGALPSTGGTLNGNLTIKGSGNYGTQINLGDGDFVHISEPVDDVMELKAKSIRFVTTQESSNPLPVNQGGTGVKTIDALKSALGISGSGIPSGVIVMWSGATTNIPSGWVLCNGSNGTPDLRDRFVVGAGNTYGVGAKGGEATHKLTVNEMPSHTHNLPTSMDSNLNHANLCFLTGAINSPIGISSDSRGGNQAHNNLPPYYALCFIMKT